jgi:hypothetical protein
MSHRPSGSDAAGAFAWHFARYVCEAGRQSLVAAAQTETDPLELLRFAEDRFRDLMHGFAESFFDSADVIPGFLPAAMRAMGKRKSVRPRCSARRDDGVVDDISSEKTPRAERVEGDATNSRAGEKRAGNP